MPPVNPVAIERLTAAAAAAQAAPHGQKQQHWRAAAADLGVSLQTVMTWKKEVVLAPPRKRRADAGTTALGFDEAQLIAAALMESHRRNGKRLTSVEQAVEWLRANGMIKADAIDARTGEIIPLSIAAITRALRAYHLHPDALKQAAPAVSLASRHPNHVWQIDASLCVLYYLKNGGDPRQAGLQVMEQKEFYKNKPANVARIENDRVWRYAITDHASGHIYVEYVMGAESGENLCHVFINATQPREGEPVHGVPLLAMLDPGSANTGAMFKNLCKALTVRVLINLPGNPRAKGQVEKAHDQIEKSFEAGLKFVPVTTLAELNQAAAKWRRWFNGSRIHRRHGETRYAAWMRIGADELRLAPAAELCRELATTAPESRVVSDKLQVSFRGATFDVSPVPGVHNGGKVMVCRNPWRPEAAQVVTVDAEGREVFYVIEPVAGGDFGFDAGAVIIGEGYRRHGDTAAQANAKAIEKLLMGETTLEGAAAARKGKRLAFDGSLDPWKHMDSELAGAPAYLPRRGTELATPLPGLVANRSLEVPPALAIEARRLNTVQLASRLAAAMPGEWTPAHYQRLQEWYAEGAQEDEVPAIAERLREFGAGPRLVAVGGL